MAGKPFPFDPGMILELPTGNFAEVASAPGLSVWDTWKIEFSLEVCKYSTLWVYHDYVLQEKPYPQMIQRAVVV